MTTLSVKRNQNVPMLLVANKQEAINLLSSGFFRWNPDIRLLFLEKEKEWLLMGQIRESLKGKFYRDVGVPVDYI